MAWHLISAKSRVALLREQTISGAIKAGDRKERVGPLFLCDELQLVEFSTAPLMLVLVELQRQQHQRLPHRQGAPP